MGFLSEVNWDQLNKNVAGIGNVVTTISQTANALNQGKVINQTVTRTSNSPGIPGESGGLLALLGLAALFLLKGR